MIGVAAAEPPPLVHCDQTLSLPLPATSTPLVLATERDGLLALEEDGQEIRVAGSDDVIEIATPPRLGRFSLRVRAHQRVTIARDRPGHAAGSVTATLDCSVGAEAERARAWSAEVQAFERAIAAPIPAEALATIAPRLDALRASAAPGYARALADHLRAQALLMSGNSNDATVAFAHARDAWLALGDRARASAALVAQAEDEHRAGRYANVLALARLLPDAPDATHYFSVRLENSRCLALEYTARLDDSANCFRWTLRALADLGETLERISTDQDYAQLERDRGDLARAQALADEAHAAISAHEWDAVAGPDIPIVRGRVERLLADLAVRRGDIGSGLTHSQRALQQFKLARHARWQANTLLRIAAIYGQIGAYADADDAVDIALQSLTARDAPARIAAAELTKADIALAEGDAQVAAEHSGRAEVLYASLGMRGEAAAAKLTAAEARLQQGDSAAAADVLARLGDIPPTLYDRAELDRLELALNENRGAAGADSAARLDHARPLAEWLRAQSVAARRLQRSGQSALAAQRLQHATQHLGELAARAGNPVLRLALERQRRRLLADALALDAGTETMRAHAAWEQLLTSERVIEVAAAPAHGATNVAFDRALAESLLPNSGNEKPHYRDPRLQQQLLDLVAAETPAQGMPSLPPVGEDALRTLQRALPCDTTLLAILPLRASYALLLVSAHDARLRNVTQDAVALRRHATALSRQVFEHGDLAAIEAAAAALSDELFADIGSWPAPRRLLLFAPEPFNGVPWPLLQWPDAHAALLDTSAITQIVPATTRARVPVAPTLHLLAAAFDDAAAGGGLATLAGANEEIGAIAAERGAAWPLRPTVVASPGVALAALDDAGSWVHFAGHGSSAAEYLGRSGLWLASSDGTQRELLSWMDVIDNGVRADVVVLNACALASSPQSSVSASIGFADAVLRAGAQDVVAALWPISDGAAGLWAATFYASLPPQPLSADVAEALRAAMLRLRASRTFRHPKYWASLVHLARFDPAAAATAPVCVE